MAATKKALAADGDLLSAEERRRIDQALADLAAAVLGERASAIAARTEALDDATHAFAGRRMDRAVARAIAGKRVDEVAETVEHARGVDAHVEAHAAMAAGGPAPSHGEHH
jgi:molecular chaperone HscA